MCCTTPEALRIMCACSKPIRAFFYFRRAACKRTSEMVPGSALERAPFQRRRFRAEVVCSPKQCSARVAIAIALHTGCVSCELILSLFDHFSTFAVLHVKKRQKWFTLIPTRASAVSEEKWFVRPSSTMFASLAHHVSSFSFDF